MTISDEAVEAAAIAVKRGVLHGLTELSIVESRLIARATLEAALPFLLAEKDGEIERLTQMHDEALLVGFKAVASRDRMKAERRAEYGHLVLDPMADALTPFIERVKAEALRDAADAMDRQILGAPFSGASLGPWLRDRAALAEGGAK